MVSNSIQTRLSKYLAESGIRTRHKRYPGTQCLRPVHNLRYHLMLS